MGGNATAFSADEIAAIKARAQALVEPDLSIPGIFPGVPTYVYQGTAFHEFLYDVVTLPGRSTNFSGQRRWAAKHLWCL